MDFSRILFKNTQRGVPIPYTQTLCVIKRERTKEKYAIVALSKPSLPPHKNTMIIGIKKALKRTGKSPPSMIFKGRDFIVLPIKKVHMAARSVTKEPKNTS